MGQLGLTEADLVKIFQPTAGCREQIGLELEYGLVDPSTGMSIAYDGPRGGRRLLQLIVDQQAAQPLTDGEHLVGAQMRSGAHFSLEMGGALEYSSTPMDSLAAVVRAAQTDVRTVAEVARELGIAVLSGGVLPFTPMDQIPWIPKPRVKIMRTFFDKLGEGGSLADGVMGLTLSNQISLDYLSISDLFEKLRLHVAASPALAALFVNSPIVEGKNTGVKSRRMQFWQKIDPARCRVQSFALDSNPTLLDLAGWALDLSMIYRSSGVGSKHHIPATETTFRRLLADGFPDGRRPTLADWESLLSQVWPQVRVRRTLELRALDGAPWSAMAAPAAVWTGLTYDPTARAAALQLLRNIKATEVEEATQNVAADGMQAAFGPYRVQDVSRELLRLARAGLVARVEAGLEPVDVLGYLDPVEEVAETGKTFAERLVDQWTGPFGERPDRYVDAFRI